MKVESLFLEKYFGARAALPLPQETEFFEGALSASYEEGVFKNVLHYDVASLYPSLMLVIGKCPRNDYLQVFLRELRQLREYRLHYKNLAKIAVDETERREYDARQKSFKILINSFYGYLGLATAVFGDTSLADEITARGRDLLVKLMDAFVSEGCSILEADTDGIYLTSPDYYDKPEALLEKVMHVLPDGVDLDYDGKYPAMFCYKAKNYALLQSDGEVVLRGSSFRNRAAEPFLRSLTRMFVEDKLRGEDRRIYDQIDDLRAEMVEIVDTTRINLREQINSALRRGANAALRSNLNVGNRRPNMRRMVEDAEDDNLTAADSLQMMQQGLIERPDTTVVSQPVPVVGQPAGEDDEKQLPPAAVPAQNKAAILNKEN